jgi:hypothetical protein
MNNLYTFDATSSQTLFGTPNSPTPREDLFIIGQRPDCSQFLVLSFQDYPGLDAVAGVPEGFDFTYCQEWGLTINEQVVQRVWADIRSKAYGSIPQQLDKIFHDGMDAWKTQIQAVKDRYPKLV